jgi:HSP20 family protein
MSNLTLWRSPFADLWFRSLSAPVNDRAGFFPAAEVVRDGDDGVVRVELPGINPDTDVTVEVDRGSLVVRGERREERSEGTEDSGRHLREVRYGSFRRTFRLPEHINGEDLHASYDAGVLSVRIPRAYAGREPVRVAVHNEGNQPDTGEQAAA